MSTEIKAVLGLDEARFDQGLSRASRSLESFAQRSRARPITILPEKSARESARVFEEIDRAREEHLRSIDSSRIDSALGSDPFGIGGSGKSAAASAAVFEDTLRRQEQQTHDLARAQEDLATTKRRIAYDEANTVGRIRIVQGELVDLAKRRDTQQRGTVDRLRTELQIEERLARLRGLQRSQQAQNISVLPPLAQVERQASGIVAVLRRQFGGSNLVKGVLHTLGVGSVGAFTGAVTSFFSRSADTASSTEQLTAGNADNLKNTLSTLGGMSTRLRLNEREFRDLGVQIDITRRTLQDLEGNPLNLIHPLWQQQVDKVKQELNGLLARQNAIGNETTLLSRDVAYQTDQYTAQIAAIESLNAARLRGAGQLELANSQLLGIEERLLLARIHKRPREELRALTSEYRQQLGVVRALESATRRQRTDAAQSLTAQAVSGSRTFANGQRRPRTETERLADRAQRERAEAREAILTGQPERARDRLAAAGRTESTVASRLQRASSAIPRGKDEGGLAELKVELTSANKLLKSIDASLTKTGVGAISRK